VVLVGDGIAHVYGLNKIQAGEMVDNSVLIIYPPSATNAKNKKVFLLVQLGIVFCTTRRTILVKCTPLFIKAWFAYIPSLEFKNK